jgi:alginate O-acetyltransferase complex protein AlgI
MNFASWTFVLLFLPAALLLFRFLTGWRRGLLIALSFLFYAWSGAANLLVFAGSIAVNAAAGWLLLERLRGEQARRALLRAAVGANILLLLAFKIAALQAPAPDGFLTAERILIPLALSFVTFQQISFLVTAYKRQIERFSLRDYLFFIAFFPHLVMGPILRFDDISAQLRSGALDRVRAKDVAVGLAIFTFGLAQKVLLADQIAVPVDSIFATAQTEPIHASEAWFAIIGFQFQLYFDFAGYADMAIGLARMVGIRMPINFDRPLFAKDRFDLWRRWHITFAMFMRAHVFMPLMRRRRWPAWAALGATGLLSGLWHGLGITFVIWGIVQTLILLYAHWRRKRTRNAADTRLRRFYLIASTFLATCLVGAMFRAPTLDAAWHVYGALAGLETAAEGQSLLGGRALLMLPLCALAAWGLPNSAQLFRRWWNASDPRPSPSPPPEHVLERRAPFALDARWAILLGLLLVAALAALGDSQRFIYAQF